MYDNIKSLRFAKEGNWIVVNAMVSSEGEIMEFRQLSKFSNTIIKQNKKIFKNKLKNFNYKQKSCIIGQQILNYFYETWGKSI